MTKGRQRADRTQSAVITSNNATDAVFSPQFKAEAQVLHHRPARKRLLVGWFVGSQTSPQHASVSQRRICSDNGTCCHTGIEVADQTFYLTQSQYTDTGPASPSTDPITPGAWQVATGVLLKKKKSGWYDSTRKNPHRANGNRTQDLQLSRRTP